MILYKLTTKDYKTRDNTVWSIGAVLEKPIKDRPELCSSDVFHVYKSIPLALLLNPVHACIDIPRILECEGDICVASWDKVGVFKLKVLRELPLPEWYRNNYVSVCKEFSRLCSEEAGKITGRVSQWVTANEWVSKEDCVRRSAWMAEAVERTFKQIIEKGGKGEGLKINFEQFALEASMKKFIFNS